MEFNLGGSDGIYSPTLTKDSKSVSKQLHLLSSPEVMINILLI